MLTKEAFVQRFGNGVHMLDGATGTVLRTMGMSKGCCTAEWILTHPEALVQLQRSYADAGSEIVYAPTFRCQPMALVPHGLEEQTALLNEMLVALSRKAAPECWIAGNLTTLKGCIDTSDDANLDAMISDYRRQTRALAAADLLAAETLLHPLEAQAILIAAYAEGVDAVMISFAVKPDGTLRSGHDAAQVLQKAQTAGAAAVGINCMAADDELPVLVGRLTQNIHVPFLCKPNAGRAANGVYPVEAKQFARIMESCVQHGAKLIGGCCGTTAEYISALKENGLSRRA